jgi:hypothetical protein
MAEGQERGVEVEMTEEVTVVKKGTQLVSLAFTRNARGLLVACKAHPSLEKYMEELAEGCKGVPPKYAEEWLVEGEPSVYKMPATVNLINNTEPQFRMDRWGGKLDSDGFLNLSFLRVVGISTDGFTFTAKGGPWNAETIKALGQQYQGAIASFFANWMRPVCIRVAVTVTE